MPTQQPPAQPRRRHTTVEANLRIGRHTEENSGSTSEAMTERRKRDLEWVDTLTGEQLLEECKKRDVELPSNGGNVVTRKARLRNYVREHGRAMPRKAKTPQPTTNGGENGNGNDRKFNPFAADTWSPVVPIEVQNIFDAHWRSREAPAQETLEEIAKRMEIADNPQAYSKMSAALNDYRYDRITRQEVAGHLVSLRQGYPRVVWIQQEPGEADMTRPNEPRPDAGQTKAKAVVTPPPKDKKRRNKGTQPPPPAKSTIFVEPPRRENLWWILGAAAVVAVIALAFWLWNNRGDNNSSTPASGGQPTQAATPTQTTALTESQVKDIATKAANDAITAAGLASTSDVQKIVNDAVNKAVAELKTNAGLTPSDVKRVVDAYVQSQKQAVQAGGGSCQPGDKIGNWSEGNNPHRIEVGGHGLQHLDFYPQVGVKSVSFVVHPIADPSGVPNLAYGYGSLWEWNPPGCSYDLVADATHYAKARLDSGHSGLVVEWGTWKVLANVANLPQPAIDNLLATDKAAMKGAQAVANPAAAGGACTTKDGVRTDQDPKPNVAWDVGPVDSFRVVNVWSNQRDPNLKDHKLFLKPGESASLTGAGGAAWSWPASCGGEAQKAYDANGNPPISLAQYQAYVNSGAQP